MRAYLNNSITPSMFTKNPPNPRALAFIAIFFLTTQLHAALFQGYTTNSTGSYPEAVAIGDLNGDGRKDVAMCTSFFSNTNDNSVLIFFQNASRQFDPPVRYAAGASAYSVAIADFNGDGRNDIAVGKKTAGIRVFTQDSNGAFTNFTDYPTSYANFICSGDFNNDGLADLAGIGFSDSKVALFLQTNGALVLATNYDASYSGNNDIEAGDVNNDGLMDIVVMNGQSYATPNVSVLLQTNNGFSAPIIYDLGGTELTAGVGVGDIDGDERNDIVVSYGGNRPTSKIATFQLTSVGVITNRFSSYDIPEPIVVADMDLDGRADIVTLHGGWQTLGVYWQNTNGTLSDEQLFQPIPYASKYSPHGLAIGDINSDGMPDAVIADYNHGLIVLTNCLPHPQMTISKLRKMPNGSIVLTAPYRGSNNVCVVEGSDSLGGWAPLGMMTDYTWADTNAPFVPTRFYRLRMQ
jgi:hypothetical protein